MSSTTNLQRSDSQPQSIPDEDLWNGHEVMHLIESLLDLRSHMLTFEADRAHLLDGLPGPQCCSGRNLLHYAALRSRDLRATQRQLAVRGLSTLGRCESHVLANLEAVLKILWRMTGASPSPLPKRFVPVSYEQGLERRRASIGQLLGAPRTRGDPAIMVTLSPAAAEDPHLAYDLVRAGADAVRINCGQDDPDTWLAMIRNVRSAASRLRRPCRIAMDLAGPKIRTGAIDTRCGPWRPGHEFLRLRAGDGLLLTGPDQRGRPAAVDARGRLSGPARIGCTLPSVLSEARVGDRILFDGGKLAGIVRQVDPGVLDIEIVRARASGQKLRPGQSINLPDTHLHLPALTDKDLRDLSLVSRHADVVNYSFVRLASDIRQLRAALARLERPEMPVVLKIETRQAFENLPNLLLEVLRQPAAGVMIARGDLAAECGWERLAEIQEEMLWICEAAHLPVIWATQVLECLARKGLPTRAEVTDAAMSARAECVMLNRGPNIVETVCTLRDISERMQQHQDKKRPLLRRLQVAQNLL